MGIADTSSTPSSAPTPDAGVRSGPEPVALALRTAFERRGETVVLIETHISWVLLAGDFAWKIKKPVRLGFLDFSTLEARWRCCEEELRLNRRLAPELYLGVVPVHAGPEGPWLGVAAGEAAAPESRAPSTSQSSSESPSQSPSRSPSASAEACAPGPVVEYALKMRRLPAGAIASERLAAGTLRSADLARFAARLEGFASEFGGILSRQTESASADPARAAAPVAE